jgi:hypothetical protein
LDQVESDYCVVGAGCAGATAALRGLSSWAHSSTLRDERSGRRPSLDAGTFWYPCRLLWPVAWFWAGESVRLGEGVGHPDISHLDKRTQCFRVLGQGAKVPRDSPGRPNINTKPRPSAAAVCKMVRRSPSRGAVDCEAGEGVGLYDGCHLDQ